MKEKVEGDEKNAFRQVLPLGWKKEAKEKERWPCLISFLA